MIDQQVLKAKNSASDSDSKARTEFRPGMVVLRIPGTAFN